MSRKTTYSEDVPRAVFFDVGGVCVCSPLGAIERLEKEIGLPSNYLNVAIQETNGNAGSWQQLERGELSVESFLPLFDTELNRSRSHTNNLYCDYLRRRGLPQPSAQDLARWASIKFDSEKLFHDMMAEAHRLQPETIFLIYWLRKLRKEHPEVRSRGLLVNALTNNFKPRETLTVANDPLQPSFPIRYLFDNYIESSVIGLRKPEPRIFEASRLIAGSDVKHSQCMLIDDLGVNLKAAQINGWKTVKVPMNGAGPAMREAAKLLGIDHLIDWSQLSSFDPKKYVLTTAARAKI